MNEQITAIVKRIDQILLNKQAEPLDQIGGYIVGTTLALDDWAELLQEQPLLDELAELAAELETLGGSEHATVVYQELSDKFTLLKLRLIQRPPS